MPTYIYNKKDFIEFIETQVKEGEVIAFTNEMNGTLSFSKKKGTIIPFQFAPDSFQDQGVGHIHFNESTPLGILIVKESRLTEQSKKAMLNIQNS